MVYNLLVFSQTFNSIKYMKDGLQCFVSQELDWFISADTA